jgi:hypothetical protein
LWFYPVSYRVKLAAERAGKKGAEASNEPKKHGSVDASEDRQRNHFVFVLSRFEHLTLSMSFTKLLQSPVDYHPLEAAPATGGSEKQLATSVADTTSTLHSANAVSIDVIRLIELTERASAVQQAVESDTTRRNDPLSNAYSTFAALNGFEVEPKIALLSAPAFGDAVAEYAEEKGSEMIIVPWAAAASSSYEDGPALNPLETLFAGQSYERSPQYASFVRSIFQTAACDVGLFLDQGVVGKPSALPGGRQHIFLAFFGGPDDRAALEFVVQLCRHPGVSATIQRYVKVADDSLVQKASDVSDSPAVELAQYTMHGGITGGDTMYGPQDGQTQIQSDTADNLAVMRYFPSSQEKASALSTATEGALTRIAFTTISSPKPLQEALKQAETVSQAHPSPLLVVTGRSRRQAMSHRDEMAAVLREHSAGGGHASLGIVASTEVRKTIGEMGSCAILKLTASLLVIQSKVSSGLQCRMSVERRIQ